MLDLSALKQALNTYTKTCQIPSTEAFQSFPKEVQDAIKAGVIQNFEFTYELCWKFMKRWLEKNLGSTYVDGVSRRALFRLAAESQLIEGVETWMFYHQARNQTSHVYDANVAQEVYEASLAFLNVAQAFLTALASKND